MRPAYQSGRGNRKSISAGQTFRRNLTHVYNRKKVCAWEGGFTGDVPVEDGCALTQIPSVRRLRLLLTRPLQPPPDKPPGCILYKKPFSFLPSFLVSALTSSPRPQTERAQQSPTPAEHGVRDATKGGERTIINETKLSAVLLTTKAGLHEKKKKKKKKKKEKKQRRGNIWKALMRCLSSRTGSSSCLAGTLTNALKGKKQNKKHLAWASFFFEQGGYFTTRRVFFFFTSKKKKKKKKQSKGSCEQSYGTIWAYI